MRVRAARDDEVERLQRIEVAAGAMFRDVGMPEIAEGAPPTVAELRDAAAILVAVDEEDEPIGYARIELVDDHAHLEQLSVVPEQGRRGIGTALLEAVAAWARARGDAAVTLTTFRDIPFNAPLYRRRGYEVIDDEELGPELTALIATEAAHGLDPARRVAMRRGL